MVIDARPVNSMDRLEAALNALVADQKSEAAKVAEAEPEAAVPGETSE
jgi:hypothetical protein